MAELTVLGVDGCPGGWVGAVVTFSGPAATAVRWLLLPDAAAILAAVDHPGSGVVAAGVDMPIGLADTGPRECDRQARRLLGPRGPSVFPAPVRAVLGADSYADACARSRTASGRAVPRQVYHLLPRLADLDEAITGRPDAAVVEVHPELAFLRMAGAALPAKKQAEGRTARLAALGDWLADPAGVVAAAPRPARFDDAADALACAWSARRWAVGAATVLPADPPTDARGLPMRIVS